jgi:hypothetical protein
MLSKLFRALKAAKEEFFIAGRDLGDGSFGTVINKNANTRPTVQDLVGEYLEPGETIISSIHCKWLNKPRASNMTGPDLFYATQDRLLYWAGYLNLSEFKFATVDYYSFEERSPTKQADKEFTIYFSFKSGSHLLLAGPEKLMKDFFDCLKPLLKHARDLKEIKLDGR